MSKFLSPWCTCPDDRMMRFCERHQIGYCVLCGGGLCPECERILRVMSSLLEQIGVPSLEELRGKPCAAQKAGPKVVERAAKVQAAKLTEREAKAAVWITAKFRCERCGKPVEKGVDSLTAGHVHHLKKRSQGGTWALNNLQLLCTWCHGREHS